MAITTVADLLKSLGANVPEPAAPPKPSVVSKAAQDPKTVKLKKASSGKWAAMMAKYPRYNPEVEGYGNADEWRGTFHARMGWEKAMKILGTALPRTVLGVADNADWLAIKSAYRGLSMDWHPDRLKTTGKDPVQAAEMWEKVSAAYEILETEHERDEAQKTKRLKKQKRLAE